MSADTAFQYPYIMILRRSPEVGSTINALSAEVLPSYPPPLSSPTNVARFGWCNTAATSAAVENVPPSSTTNSFPRNGYEAGSATTPFRRFSKVLGNQVANDGLMVVRWIRPKYRNGRSVNCDTSSAPYSSTPPSFPRRSRISALVPWSRRVRKAVPIAAG